MKRKHILVDLDNVCSIGECTSKFYAKGWCNTHYAQDYYRKKGRLSQAERWRIIKSQRLVLKQAKIDLVVAEKDQPCADCGNRFPSYVMDFDHIKGTKRFNISKAMHGTWSIKTMRAEMAKCEVICANCHRIRTHGGGSNVQ